MRKQLIAGQIVCIAGLLLLVVFVPSMPRVRGLPQHRIAEMFVFWCGEGMLVFGMGLTFFWGGTHIRSRLCTLRQKPERRR